MQRLSGTAPLR